MIDYKKFRLHSSREIMQAFLDGYKLINNAYGLREGGMYLYLEETGYIAEEDGAGAKANRVPILLLEASDWWEILDPEIHGMAFKGNKK